MKKIYLTYDSKALDDTCHIKFIDEINKNPGNCSLCGRLYPKKELDKHNGLCYCCFDHRHSINNFIWDSTIKSYRKRTEFEIKKLEHDFYESISDFKQNFPEYFQVVN